MKQEKVEIETGNGTDRLSGVISAPDGRHSFDQERTLVIMVHDIPYGHSRDHDDLFGYLRNVFDEHHYKTLFFDFESCGDSDGKEEEFTLDRARDNLKKVLVWAHGHGFERFIFVASGTAAALCLEIAEKDFTRMMFLFWPVVDLAGYAKRIFYDDGAIVAKGRKLGHDLIAQMEKYDPKTALKKLWIPILVQYGGEGSSTDIELIKTSIKALRIDVTSYGDGTPGLTDPRHRKMIAHHVTVFLKKYA